MKCFFIQMPGLAVFPVMGQFVHTNYKSSLPTQRACDALDTLSEFRYSAYINSNAV